MRNLKILKNVKGYASSFALMAMVASLVMFSGCKDDDGDGVSVVGRYQITSAVLHEETSVEVPGVGVKLPAGHDAVQVFAALVANAGPCGSGATAIELTNNNKMLYVCLDDADLNEESGEWLISSDGKTLTILITTTTLTPPNPITVPLNVTDFVVTETTLSGTIEDFPFFPGVQEPDTAPQVQTVSMDVKFARL